MDNLTIPSLLGPTDLGKILGLTRRAIYQRSSMHPEALPPRFHLPHSKLLRWHPRVVQEWLDSQAGFSGPAFSSPSIQAPPPPQQAPEIKRRRGRPTKAEQIANARRGGTR